MISERTFIISLSIKYRLWKYVAFVIPSFGAAHMVIICTGKQRVGIIAFDIIRSNIIVAMVIAYRL